MNRWRALLLYGTLAVMAAMFAFPFYWLVMSSLKSPAGMTMIPPAFYPCEVRARSVAVEAAGRVFRADGKRWFRLCPSRDLLGGESAPGGYYVRLEGDRPSRLVAWRPDEAVEPENAASGSIEFDALPVHRIVGRNGEAAIAGKMVRQSKGGFDELLFVAPERTGGAGGFEVLLNPRHREIRDFSARWKNYPETLRGPEATIGARSSGFLLFMRNSFFISVMAVIGQVITSSLVAFGFARLRFRGRETLFILLLATLMIPAQVTLIPLFSIYKSLGWIDTFLPLIVPHFTAGAFNVFLIRQYMLTLPRELDESAAIDGCGPGRTWLFVIMPNCVPVLIVVGLFTFVYTWQDVMGPLIYLDNPAYRTVTLGLEYFRSPYVDNRHLLMTGATLAMLPVAAVFLILQRYIMAGIATTGLRG